MTLRVNTVLSRCFSFINENKIAYFYLTEQTFLLDSFFLYPLYQLEQTRAYSEIVYGENMLANSKHLEFFFPLKNKMSWLHEIMQHPTQRQRGMSMNASLATQGNLSELHMCYQHIPSTTGSKSRQETDFSEGIK